MRITFVVVVALEVRGVDEVEAAAPVELLCPADSIRPPTHLGQPPACIVRQKLLNSLCSGLAKERLQYIAH